MQPRKESSTKASPGLLSDIVPSAEMNSITGVVGPNESTIKQNNNNHRKGPNVDPCPGPKSGLSVVF